MTHPYRPLFNELSEDLFAIAKGMVERAVVIAQAAPLLSNPGPLSLLRHALESKTFAKTFGERFGWQRVLEMSRRADCEFVDFVVRHHCGHAQRLTIDELEVQRAPRAMLGIGDALRAAQEREPRACYCIPRPTP